jgi:hypothetical protein
LGSGEQDQVRYQDHTRLMVEAKVRPGQVILCDNPQAVVIDTSKGAKFDGGKVGVWMLPTEPLEDIARVLDFGAKKYAAYNWTNGIKYSRIYGSLLRHLFAWWRGEDVDPESGLSHLSHAGCNILFLLQFARSRPSFDDRPVKHYANESE